MTTHSPTRRTTITYLAFYLILAAVAFRVIMQIEKASDVQITLEMLAFYLVLLLFEPKLISRSLVFLHVFNALQTMIGLFLLLLIDQFDFYCLLFIPPCALSILHFPRMTAFVWIGGICLLMVMGLLEHFPLTESSGLIIAYLASILFFTGSAYLAMEAEEERNRSEALLADLKVANRKLEAYAVQVRALAAAAERNRLARELHDSVTQVIFGLTLSAQAARILIKRDPNRAEAEMEHIQVLAQNALGEMRALIQQLHPRSIADEGLPAALRRLTAERQANDGLTIDLQIHGDRRLPANIEEDLFRIAQEAVNNIIKHAQTSQAAITLNLDDAPRICMTIEDAGVGFNLEKARAIPGHLGLTSMAERIQAVGGTLTIDSTPGKGTHLRVEFDLTQEVAHA